VDDLDQFLGLRKKRLYSEHEQNKQNRPAHSNHQELSGSSMFSGTPRQRLGKALAWIPVPVIFALFILRLPETSAASVIITQIPFLALSGFIFYSLYRGEFSPAAMNIALAWAALAGLAFATYLAIKWGQGVAPQCSSGGCAKAQFSKYGRLFFEIRTTSIGIFGYSLVLLSLFLPGLWGRMITAFLATFGFAVSVYLTSASVFVLETTCQWCLGSAAAMTTLLVLSFWRLIRQLAAAPAKEFES